MAEKRKRGQNFTTEEKDKLVKLLLEHKNTILNKKTDGTTNEAKTLAWNELTASFNAAGSIYRSKESLLKVWEKMKSESKLYYSTTRRNFTQTGGGPSVVKTDPILEQVCNIMGRGCTGIEGVIDSDSIDASSQEESFPKVICIEDIEAIPLTDVIQIDNNNLATEVTIEPEVCIEPIIKTPLWSRRRPVSSQTNERSQAMGSLCSSFQSINNKKENVETIKYALLEEELEFKKKLYDLQIQAAAKELIIKDLEIAIKSAVIDKIKGDSSSTKLQENNY